MVSCAADKFEVIFRNFKNFLYCGPANCILAKCGRVKGRLDGKSFIDVYMLRKTKSKGPENHIRAFYVYQIILADLHILHNEVIYRESQVTFSTWNDSSHCERGCVLRWGYMYFYLFYFCPYFPDCVASVLRLSTSVQINFTSTFLPWQYGWQFASVLGSTYAN